MNQIPNREEEWVEAPEAVRSKCRAICGENDIDTENEDVFLYRRIEIDTATDMAYQAGLSTHHHQLQKAKEELQKARQDWLQEEIVKLKGMIHEINTEDEYAKYDGQNKAIQTIIDRYQAEVDQDKALQDKK